MHTDIACLLFNHLKRRPHPDTVRRIITDTDAVTIEQDFPIDALPVGLISMNATLIHHQYIEFLADRVLVSVLAGRRKKCTTPPTQTDFIDHDLAAGPRPISLKKRVSDYVFEFRRRTLTNTTQTPRPPSAASRKQSLYGFSSWWIFFLPNM